MASIADTHDTYARCLHCTHRGNQHRAADGRCPAGPVFPPPPRAIHSQHEPVAARAGARWDRLIAKHWATETTFRRAVR